MKRGILITIIGVLIIGIGYIGIEMIDFAKEEKKDIPKNKLNLNKTLLELEKDSIKTVELIKHIFSETDDPYINSSCIAEKAHFLHTIITTDFDSYVEKELRIEDKQHLKKQFELFKKFRITESLAFGKNIITEEQFSEFAKEAKKGNFIFWEWAESNCENGFISVSRPIFNESYNLAFVQIGSLCGGKCGGGETRIYENVNGKWNIVKTENQWIS
jgi:hypothetical protein